MPLAGHRDVLVAVQPQAHRVPGQRGPERRDGGQPVRLELLAAEPAAHPQALHGDLVRGQAEHVGHDVLGLGRVLRAGLDEDLPVLVDQGQRGLRLQVEVLLAADLELAAEPVGGAFQPGRDVAAADRPLVALVAVGLDGVVHRDQRGQRLVVGLDLGRALPGRLQGLAEHPAHRVVVVHDLAGEQRLVVLLAGVVEAGHVLGGQHPHHAGHLVGALGAQGGEAGVPVRGLDRPGVQRAERAAHQVLGVQRGPGDVQVGALVRDCQAHHGPVWPVSQRAVSSAHFVPPGRSASPLASGALLRRPLPSSLLRRSSVQAAPRPSSSLMAGPPPGFPRRT